jgi:hypothetical protein
MGHFSRASRVHPPRRLIVAAALVLLSVVAGCKGPESRLPAIAAQAKAAVAAPGANVGAARAAAASALLAEWKNGLSFGDAINLASDMLDNDPTATVFAGGVLDAIEQGGERVGLGGEFEIFWMKVGRLACKAGDVAMASNRLAEARALVLAGSQRWQNDSYWRRYPDHDALAAIVLAANGERDLALQRLRSREDLESPAKEIYDQILRAPRPPQNAAGAAKPNP